MVYILYSVDALDAVACARKRWIAWIQGQQHPVLGTWPREEEPGNISRTFACSLIHLSMGGCLRGRGGSSTPCWISKGATVSGAGLPSFAAISRLQWRQEAVKAALHRLTDSLIPYCQENAECRKSNIHQFASLLELQDVASLGSEMSRLGWSDRG